MNIILALTFQYLLTIFLLSVAHKKNLLLDIPNYRKIHNVGVPLIGGLAIFISYLFFFILDAFNNNFSYFTATNSLIFFAIFIVFFSGLIDDQKNTSWQFRIFVQLISSILVVVFTDLKVTEIGTIFFEEVELLSLSIPITVLCIIGLTNALNLIDGIDGSAGIHSISVMSFLIIFSNNANSIDYFVLALITIIGGYLIFNLSEKRKIFLGDSGSLMLGFIISLLLIFYSQNPTLGVNPNIVVWLVALPIFDLFSVILKRRKAKHRTFDPNKDHLHHILIEIGFSKQETLLIIFCLIILMQIIGYTISESFLSSMSYPIFIVLFALYHYKTSSLQAINK